VDKSGVVYLRVAATVNQDTCGRDGSKQKHGPEFHRLVEIGAEFHQTVEFRGAMFLWTNV